MDGKNINNDETTAVERRRTWMREYMKARYQRNPIQARNQRTLSRIKNKNPTALDAISKEDKEIFGIYVGVLIKIRELANSIPPDIRQQLHI
jgi:hypothetical protein